MSSDTGNESDRLWINDPFILALLWFGALFLLLVCPFILTRQRREICKRRVREGRWDVDGDDENMESMFPALNVVHRRYPIGDPRHVFTKEEAENETRKYLLSKLDPFTKTLESSDFIIADVDKSDDHYDDIEMGGGQNNNNNEYSLVTGESSDSDTAITERPSNETIDETLDATFDDTVNHSFDHSVDENNYNSEKFTTTNNEIFVDDEGQEDGLEREKGDEVDDTVDHSFNHSFDQNADENNANSEKFTTTTNEVFVDNEFQEVDLKGEEEDEENDFEGENDYNSKTLQESPKEGKIKSTQDKIKKQESIKALILPHPGIELGCAGNLSICTNANSVLAQVEGQICNAECSICLNEYCEGDKVSWSSLDCPHVFHQECILEWLMTLGKKAIKSVEGRNSTVMQSHLCSFNMICPICRQQFIPNSKSETA